MSNKNILNNKKDLFKMIINKRYKKCRKMNDYDFFQLQLILTFLQRYIYCKYEEAQLKIPEELTSLRKSVAKLIPKDCKTPLYTATEYTVDTELAEMVWRAANTLLRGSLTNSVEIAELVTSIQNIFPAPSPPSPPDILAPSDVSSVCSTLSSEEQSPQNPSVQQDQNQATNQPVTTTGGVKRAIDADVHQNQDACTSDASDIQDASGNITTKPAANKRHKPV